MTKARNWDLNLLIPLDDGRSMRRTARGEDLLHQVRQLLAQVDQLAPEAFDPATAERCFSVMMSDFAARVLMPSVLGSVAGHPGISVRVRPYQAEYATELDEGTIDLLLTIEEHMITRHPVTPLFTADWVVITPVDNRLVGDTLSLEQYRSLRHVAVRYDDGRIPTMEESYVRRHAIDRPVQVADARNCGAGSVRQMISPKRMESSMKCRTCSARSVP
ncbi:LysR substrate-binding domain-containing protein [Amycolatopsis sp. GM8]|uniref:LysR substrate-binding domain-containing protein n=1 Tax=Amycolatopsis sp. GM8 TaxID=2896530 RepID=UPI001F469C82|nr:LysR substrate-binding domain-containing protein [Amycolatopsis sp. GM8]